MKSQYTVEITQLDNGYVVRAGCINLAYANREVLLKDLEAWFLHPQEVEERMMQNFKGGPAEAVETPDASGYVGGGLRERLRGESIGRLRTSLEERASLAKEREYLNLGKGIAPRDEAGAIKSEIERPSPIDSIVTPGSPLRRS